MKFIRRVWITLLIFAFAGSPAMAGYLPMVPTLQPYQVASPDGTWLLEVKPSARYGGGPANTTLTNQKTREVAWRQELPFTFWQCCVDKDGYVGGYGYSKGPMGGDPWGDDAGDFLVRILDPKGVAIHSETTSRGGGFAGFYISNPYAKRLVLDSSYDPMLVVMPDDTLRIYSLRTGVLESALPAASRQQGIDRDSLEDIRFMADSRLILLHYSCWVGNGKEETFGSRFVIINRRGSVVWTLDRIQTLPHADDRRVPRFAILPPAEDDDPFADSDPFAAVEATGDEISPPEAVHVADFELFLGDSGERVTFQVSRSGDENLPVWSVRETGRKVDVLPVEPDEDSLPAPDFPAVDAKKLSAFQLAVPGKGNLDELAAVALGTDGRIHVIEKESGLIQVFGSDGKFLHTCDPGKAHRIGTDWYDASIAISSGGEVFVKIAEHPKAEGEESDPLAKHFLRFTSEGKLKNETLAPGTNDFAAKLVNQPGQDEFLAFGYGDEVRQVALEGYPSGVETLTHRADGQWLEFIQDVACAEDGAIAVRDSSGGDENGGFTTAFSRLPNHLPAETVTIYSARGMPVRTLDFTGFEALDRIAFGGGYIIATGNFEPSVPRVYVFTDRGETVEAFDVDSVVGDSKADLRVFIQGNGKEILVVDLNSARVLRYVIPGIVPDAK